MRRSLLLLLLLICADPAGAAALLSDVYYQAAEAHIELGIRLGIPVRIDSLSADRTVLTLTLSAVADSSSEWRAAELRFEEEGRLLETVSLEGSGRKGYALKLVFTAPVEARLMPQFDPHQLLLKLAPERAFDALTRFGKPTAQDPYTINLESRQRSIPTLADLPRGFAESHIVYVTEFEQNSTRWHRLRLGFFTDRREAKRTVDALKRYFPDAWLERASANEVAYAEAFRINPEAPVGAAEAPDPDTAEEKEVQVAIELATPSTIGWLPDPEPTAPSLERPVRAAVPSEPPGEAEVLLAEAEVAFQSEDWPTAINRYGAVVATGEEPYRRQALEMLGVSRELNDQEAHAKRYYQLYLEDYPEGEDTGRVAQRLAALTAFDRPRPGSSRAPELVPAVPSWELGAYFSQFYQRQSLKVDGRSAVPIDGLFNDLNLEARRNGTGLNQEARITMSYLVDFSDSGRLDGREYQVSAAYWDVFSERLRTGVRLGRQSNWETGALGRFDGVDLTYRLRDRFGLGVTGGYLLDHSYDAPATDRPFVGVCGEYLSASGNLSIRPFFVQQYADDVLDRQAVGLSGQYYTEHLMLFSLIDYDVHYAALNNLTVTGNFRFGRSQVNASYEHRKNPYLTTRNALMGQTFGDLTDLELAILDLSLEEIAHDRTATSETLRLGWNRRFGDHWTLSADVIASDFSSTESSADVLGLEANQALYSSVQLRSSDIFGRGSYSGVMVRIANSQTSDTTSLYWDNRFAFAGSWFLYPRFRVDHRSFVRNGDEQWTYRPSLRLDYRLGRRVRFELEGGYEWSNRELADRSLDITGLFLRAGYRASL